MRRASTPRPGCTAPASSRARPDRHHDNRHGRARRRRRASSRSGACPIWRRSTRSRCPTALAATSPGYGGAAGPGRRPDGAGVHFPLRAVSRWKDSRATRRPPGWWRRSPARRRRIARSRWSPGLLPGDGARVARRGEPGHQRSLRATRGGRATLGPDDVPHWIAALAGPAAGGDHRATGAMRNRVMIARFDSATGRLSRRALPGRGRGRARVPDGREELAARWERGGDPARRRVQPPVRCEGSERGLCCLLRLVPQPAQCNRLHLLQ